MQNKRCLQNCQKFNNMRKGILLCTCIKQNERKIFSEKYALLQSTITPYPVFAIYHTSNKFPVFPLVKMTSHDCPISYYIGSATKNMGLVKFKMASYINIK